jgi:hypothetical protein
MSIIPNIAKLLEDNGLGILDTDLFYTIIPHETEGISLIERGGTNNFGIVNQRFDIYARYNNGNFARNRIEAIEQFLCDSCRFCKLPALTNCTDCEIPEFNGQVTIRSVGALESLGRDENNNFLFRISLEVIYKICN